MPIYDYRCGSGHEFEVFQSMSDDPVSECPECGAAVERVFHPVAVHFKGSGFYTTDYARSGSKDGKSSSSGDAKKESASDGATKSDSKKDSGGDKAKAGSSGD